MRIIPITSSDIEYSNIIKNSQLKTSYGIFKQDNINLKECSIMNNNDLQNYAIRIWKLIDNIYNRVSKKSFYNEKC